MRKYKISDEYLLFICKDMYINDYSIREACKIYNVKRSTLHNNIRYRLASLDPKLFYDMCILFNYNKNMCCYKGANARHLKVN